LQELSLSEFEKAIAEALRIAPNIPGRKLKVHGKLQMCYVAQQLIIN
jgi:hypothetical protein